VDAEARRVEKAEVVIIGGGVVGSATAYALLQAGMPGRDIVVVERDPSYQACSTARSAGGVRQQFSTRENIQLSQATLALLRELKDRFGSDADVSFREQGYLLLASEGGRGVLADNVRLQRSMGADTHLLDVSALAERFPWLACEGLAAGSFGVRGEGWMDPVALMTLLRQGAQAGGVRWRHATVAGIDVTGSRAQSVRLETGEGIEAAHIVNAAGPQAGDVARLAGIALPVEPRKRYVYVVDCREASEALYGGPLTVDPSGVWFRPEGRRFICGVSPEEADEPAPVDLDAIDYEPYETIVWPALAARVPVFEQIKLVSAWAGFYDYNRLDQNGIIGAHPSVTNFYFGNGFSGHGLQQGYAVGRGIAELITKGRFESIDLRRFGFERVQRGEPLFELNII
jgi:glycine/D-amino acid oxidase-like deaminating enzyme